MLLNLHIIQEDATELNLKGEPKCAFEDVFLAFPLTCDHIPKRPAKNTLYVLKSKNLPDEPTKASVICIGKPACAWALSSSNVLYTETADSQEALTCLLGIFERYRSWEEKLLDLTIRRRPLQDFVDCTGSMLGNPLSIMGGGFLVMASFAPHDESPTKRYGTFLQNEFVPHGEMMTDASIELLIADPDYEKTAHTKGLAIFPGKYTGAQALYQNIYENDILASRVLVEDVVRPFSRRDYAIIATLAKYVEIWLQGRSNPEYDRHKYLDEVLSSLLNHKLLPRGKIETLLDAFHWGRTDDFICITLRHLSHVCMPSELNTIVRLLIPIAGDCYGTFRDETIFVCNLTQQGVSRRALIASMIPALRDNMFTAGFSAQYTGFENLYYYYRQAAATLDAGIEKDPQTWHYRYEDYAIDCILAKCLHKNIPEAIEPEGLRKLRAHDANKGTDYVGVLRAYLDNERNVQVTAQATFAHRSTLRYQLTRIQEIMGIDLDDPDQRICLQIALRAQQAAN